MNIAIIDDRKADADCLAEFLNLYVIQNHITAPTLDFFQSGEEFLASFSHGKYDILFLDIYMDGMSGMDTAHKIREQDLACKLIFITTSPDFAVESYYVNAVFYLLKPLTQKNVFTALDRCNLQLTEDAQFIEVPVSYGTYKLRLHEIAYTEYTQRKIQIHLINGPLIEVLMKQADFTDMILSYPFLCNCIKGIIVNFEEVEKLLDNRFLLKDGTSIPISRLKYKEVREQFFEYTYSKLRREEDIP